MSNEIDWLHEQLYQQRDDIENLAFKNRQLEQTIELLTVEVNLIKNEGCWRYFQGLCPKHKDKDE